jgi:hypothetical protein
VALRTARRARATSSRFRPADAEQLEVIQSGTDEVYQFDLRPLLLEELDQLPGKYREPIVLCHLEGKTHEEAARLLQWPVGTVSGRLSRGRQLLKARLERRGLTVAPAMLAAPWLTGLRSPLSLLLEQSAFTAALQFVAAKPVSASILSLTYGVLRTMMLRKIKIVALAVMLIGTTTGSVGVWAHWSQAPATPERAIAPAVNPSASPAPSEQPASGSSSDTQPLLARKSTVDCPVFDGDGSPTNCPITMAANAFARMFHSVHGGSSDTR